MHSQSMQTLADRPASVTLWGVGCGGCGLWRTAIADRGVCGRKNPCLDDARRPTHLRHTRSGDRPILHEQHRRRLTEPNAQEVTLLALLHAHGLFNSTWYKLAPSRPEVAEYIGPCESARYAVLPAM